MLGVRASQPTYANRANYKPVATWSQMLFHGMFGPSDPNHATTEIDDSPINATMTFHGAAEITTSLGGVSPSSPLWTSALALLSNGSYVSTPHHVAYDGFGIDDFTVEFFFARNTYVAPIQWLGVWNDGFKENQQWRVINDSVTFRFQWMQGGQVKEIMTRIGLNNNQWYRIIFERYLSQINFWIQREAGGPVVDLWASGTFAGHMDVPTNPVELWIGGTPTSAALGWMRDVLVTRGAKYRGSQPPTVATPPGYIYPPLHVDTNTFRTPLHIGQIISPQMIDADVFPAPIVQRTERLFPSKVTDTDRFYVVGLPPNFNPDSCCQGLIPPAVLDHTIGSPYPVFEDETVTTGSGISATLTLPTTRNTNDLLWAIIHVDDEVNIWMPGGTANGGGGPSADPVWYWRGHNDRFNLCNTFVTGFPIKNVSGRSTYIVDGSETAPVFTFHDADNGGGSPVSRNWTGRILRFSNIDWQYSFPFWDYNMNHGISANLRSQEAHGLPDPPTTQLPYSDAYLPNEPGVYGFYVKFIVTKNNQVLPDQPFYHNIVKQNTPTGSILVCVQNSGIGINTPSAQAFDNWGSGAILNTITSTFWEADVFSMNTLFPVTRLRPAIVVSSEQIYSPTVTHS